MSAASRLRSAASALLRALSSAMPKDAFAESRRITERLRRESGGSFSICYTALKAESQAAGYDAALSEEAVVARIRAMR